MPVTVVVGGQFGSEGKGKVAHFLARETNADLAIRIGGPNSGHTVITSAGRPLVFRHLPTTCLLPGVKSVIPPGSYLDPVILLKEIALVQARPGQLAIDPHAWLVTNEDVEAEKRMDLRSRIGSTGTGTGKALIRRMSRNEVPTFAKDVLELQPYIEDTADLLTRELAIGKRVILEGTQGFGLSPLHSRYYPNCTSRDTTAAAFLSESGLSPLDVDQVVLVIRAHSIRVAGNSGPLRDEITWETVTAESGSPHAIVEHTSVTHNIRRVSRFDAEIVKRAIKHNRPTHIALNHLDYIDFRCDLDNCVTQQAMAFVRSIESQIERNVDLLGFGPNAMQWRALDKERMSNQRLVLQAS